MTLHDLTEQLSIHFPVSVQKDLKTAVRVLAQALQYPDAKSCPLEACLQPIPDLYQMVETFLTSQAKGSHTIRNTKNNLSRLFRLAETQELLSPLPTKPTRRFSWRSMPKQRPGSYTRPDGSYLPRHQWPPEVQAEFSAFAKWGTDPLVDGRDTKWKKRPITMQNYDLLFQAYFGYLYHILMIRPIQFDHLFDFSLIEKFVYWHVNEKYHRPTHIAHNFIRSIHAMAHQYRPDASLMESLKALRKRLPKLNPLYNKSDSWISLHEIEQIGMALWPEKSPSVLQSNGYKLAARAGLSLMLRLWVHIPYRQRNMREMKLKHNLHRTPEGHWRIRFTDEQLKIARRRGQSNIFDLPFPPMLIDTLECYLNTWRPILSRVQNHDEVFLNPHGRPYTTVNITEALQGHIYSFTGRHWHPHIMRSVWATEWIRAGGDFMTAAIMLNDRLETVIKNYSHLRDENVAENAYLWVQNRVNHHHPSS